MSKGLNRFAILVACATFFLIIAGALVTSNDAGLATSDWPLSNGQFLPPMVGNMFYEHGHRMIATTVGLLTIGLAIYIRFGDKRFWVWRLGFFALFAVIVQGILGGLTGRCWSHFAECRSEAPSTNCTRIITRAIVHMCRSGVLACSSRNGRASIQLLEVKTARLTVVQKKSCASVA